MAFDPTSAVLEESSGFDPSTAVAEASGFDPASATLVEAPPQGTATNITNALGRGATAEGVYAGIEGGARLIQNQPILPALLTGNPVTIGANLLGGGVLQRINSDAARWYGDAVRDTRQSIRTALPVDQSFAESKLGQISQGIGQAAGTLPLYAVPGVGVGSTVGQTYDEAYQEAKSSGATDAAANIAALKYLPSAALDVIADKLVIGKILKPIAGRGTVGRVLKDVAITGASNAATEAAQTRILNEIAGDETTGYDKGRDPNQGVLDSAIVGGIVPAGITGIAQTGKTLLARIASKTPEQASKAIREEIKTTEDVALAKELTDAADAIDREVAARKEVETQQKEAEAAAKEAQKAAADAQKAQADAVAAANEVPKSTQILNESKTPPPLANVATEAGTQTSPFALQGKLNEITGTAPPPAPLPEIVGDTPAPKTSKAKENFERRKALFDAKKKAEKAAAEAATAQLEAPGEIARAPALPALPADMTPRQRAAAIRAQNAGVAGVKFKAPMAEPDVSAPPFEAPKPLTEADIKAAKSAELKAAVAVPGVDYQYTVFRMEDGKPPVVQIDIISPEGKSLGSTNLKDLKAAGVDLPAVPDSLPQRQYTLAEVRAASAPAEAPVAIPAEAPRPASVSAPTADNRYDILKPLSESRLLAVANQLGVDPQGMSGERLRSRLSTNASEADIVDAIANPVAPPAPKRGKIKGSKADKWADSVLKEGRTLSNFDPELLAALTVKLAAQLESGAIKFADWSAQKITEVGEGIRPYLQQIWDAAQAQVAATPGERVFSSTPENRGVSKSALGKYDYIKTTNAEQLAHAQSIIEYVQKTGDFEGGFAKLDNIRNPADRSVAAAAMISEAYKIEDANLRDRTVARLFREAKQVVGTESAQALQAQGTVNDLIAPYRGHLAWMDIIQSRLKEEVAPLFPENSSEIINKGVKDAGNEAAGQLAPDGKIENAVLKSAVDRVKKAADIDWKKIFTDLPEKQAERKAEIFKRINEDPKVVALPDAAKVKLAEAMEKAWETLKNKAFRREFNKVIELPNVGKVQREALKKALPKLTEQANLGLLDNEAFLNAVGESFGIEGIDSATGKKLKELGQKAARTPEGSERNEVFQEIMDTIMEARGVNPWDFLKDYWYRNVMSAPRTAVEIGAGGILQGAATTFTTAVDTAIAQRRPDIALRMIGMFLKDSATGARLGADLIATGDRAILPRYTEQFLQRMKALEEGKSPGGEIESLYRRTNGMQRALIRPFELTGRILTALDYIGGQGVRSQQMLYSALTKGDKASFDAAMRRFNAEQSSKAEARAKQELGPDARSAQVIARTREILNEGISQDVQDFGNRMTEVTALNAPPIGLGGKVYDALSQLPMIVKAPTGLAFLKAGINIFQNITNWGPVTGQINLARSLWRNPSPKNPLRFLALDKLPPERARQLAVAQATGLAVLAAAAAKFLTDQPEDKEGKPRAWDISGSWDGITPAQKSQLMSAGERPLSIKLPSGRWVDYKLTPFMSALGTIGHWRDQQRFNGKKWDEETITNKVGNAWLSGLASAKDLSVASQFSKVAGLLAADDRPLDAKGFESMIVDSVGNAAVGLIPMSSLLRELDNNTDSQRYRPDRKNPGIDLWLSQVPFVRRWVGETENGQSRPLLNFLGEPVQVEVTQFNRHVGPPASTKPVEAAVSEKVSAGMKLPVLADNTTIVDKDAKARPMNGEEAYTYQKAVRQAYARQVASDLTAFQQATPEQAALYSHVVFSAAERYARDRMNTGAPLGVIPVDPKLSSALSPEYQAVKAQDSAEGSGSALDASRMRVQYDNMMTLPEGERITMIRDLATKQPDIARKLIQHATSRTTGRDVLQKATAGLQAPSRAEYFVGELAKRTTPEEKQAFLRQQLGAGLLSAEVMREMSALQQRN